jgi:hypothetical protein
LDGKDVGKKRVERDTLEADSDLVICVAVNLRDAASLLCSDSDLKAGSLAN